VASERELAALAVRVGARKVPTWSGAESSLTRDLPDVPADFLAKAVRSHDLPDR